MFFVRFLYLVRLLDQGDEELNFSRLLSHWLAITASIVAFLFMSAGCGGESGPPPTPTPALPGLLTNTGEKLATISTAKMTMIDEKESGAKFYLSTIKSVEAQVKAPDSFKILVNADAPGFGLIEIEMIAIGENAFLKFTEEAPWAPLPLKQVPFNFAGLGQTMRDVLFMVRDGDGAITGSESVNGIQTTRVEGKVLSEHLSDLITSADPGLELVLTLWIDETDQSLKQMRIAGRLYNNDGPETSRLLTVYDIDVPVEIEPPM